MAIGDQSGVRSREGSCADSCGSADLCSLDDDLMMDNNHHKEHTTWSKQRMFFHTASGSKLSLLKDPVFMERLQLFGCITGWYLIGVGAIVTTKILLTMAPPLALTFQQLLLGSTVLRIFLSFRGPKGVQPLPWEHPHHPHGDEDLDVPAGNGVPLLVDSSANSVSASTSKGHTKPKGLLATWNVIWEHHSDFLLAGLFNSLDFLASNTAFNRAAASFVETIKSSDPITTTAVALAWNVDRLEGAESFGLLALIVGVLFSTYGNAESKSSQDAADAAVAPDLRESVIGASTVVIANMCFAFRAMFQKRYRAGVQAQHQLDDTNLLCRMQQTGALALLLPAAVVSTRLVMRNLYEVPAASQLRYVGLSAFNALCYSIYNLASTYVLSKLSVLQHSSLNCLRRMFAIVATCIFFGVPITLMGALGLLTSFAGFFAFTILRHQRQQRQKELTLKDSLV